MVHLPFGNPDGSRADIKELTENGFIDFKNERIWGGIATQKDDYSARVIAGRKGSGKTVYLRRMAANASNQESIYSDDIQQDLPSSDNIIRFCQWFPENLLTEKWMHVWRIAILRSVISHFLYSKILKQYIDNDNIKLLITEFKNYIPSTITPLSVYSQVSEIIVAQHSSKEFNRYIDDNKWNQIEYIIGELLKTSPPIYFYIDAVDEEYSHAPMYWLRCQKGLFYQTMRYLRDSKFGGRLHIFICIRDHVLSSVYRSEHATRYINEPHIRILRWDINSSMYLLNAKLEKLEDKFFFISNSDKNIKNWLGLEKIHNKVRDIDESVIEYILRHTRLLPRDIIQMGNELCNIIIQAKSENQTNIEDKVIETVGNVSRQLGNEAISICANQLLSDLIPERAAMHNYSSLYTSNKEFATDVRNRLKQVIKFIGKDRFSEQEMDDARKKANKLFDQDVNIFSILWINGLLGYINEETDKPKFFAEHYLDDFQFPRGQKQYIFHSILIDSVNINGIGKPIQNF